MQKWILGVATCALALAATSGQAAAFEGGGRSPSAAPLIEWGQHYAGQLNNHQDDANFSSSDEVAFWKLPPVSTRDVVAVNWHALPFTRNSGDFPICMVVVQGIDDFSWGATFERMTDAFCHSTTGVYELSGSGTARTEITLQQTDSAATYLEFFADGGETNPSYLETYPYDFSVEAPRHALTLTLPGVPSIPTNGVLSASATGATGLPAPDGLLYTLTANWEHNGVWIGTAASIGGRISFQLALPESAINERVRFIVSRPPDALFQAVESQSIRAKVMPPYVPPPSGACTTASSRAGTLARQRHRLQAHLHRARGRTKGRLRHKLGHVTRALHAAQAAVKAACG